MPLKTTEAIRIQQPGGPEVLRWETIPIPEPGEGEVLIQHTAIGLNFIDIYHRTGLYKLPSYPAIPGNEGAGIVIKNGSKAGRYPPGTRVCYAGGPLGAYARHRVIPERHLIEIPPGVTDEVAAAIMLKGLTAHYLLRRTFLVHDRITLLVHAAAGGVGLLLCQWAKYLGARVIGTVGSEEKAKLAFDHGCEFPIVYTKEDVVQCVRQITGGKGVNVVYDSVGQATFMQSLDCLMHFGLLASFGQSSGPVPPFDISLLAQKGSLFLTRPTLFHYIQNEEEYIMNSAELFYLLTEGRLKALIGQTYPLTEAAQAQRDLEARKTTGSTLLIP